MTVREDIRRQFATALRMIKDDPHVSGAEIGRQLGLGPRAGQYYREAALELLAPYRRHAAPAAPAAPAPRPVVLRVAAMTRTVRQAADRPANDYTIPVFRDME